MDLYREPKQAAACYRRQYLESIRRLVESRRSASGELRKAFMAGLEFHREERRRDLRAMLGWPLTEPPAPCRCIRKDFVARDSLCAIYRLQLEVFPGFFAYGMLFTTGEDSPLPLILCKHGGYGTPEACSGLWGETNYRDMTRRFLRRGVNAFAPQTLLWNPEEVGDGFDRDLVDRDLKQVGGSLAALELYVIQRWIDHLETLPFVDGKRIGMAGLSYGGFFTLFTAALDARVKSALSSGYFNDRYRHAKSDWVWQNSGNTFMDAEVGALVCPRALFIENGTQDKIFDCASSYNEARRLAAYYAGHEDRLKIRFFEGGHEFAGDDEGVDFLLEHLD